MIAIAIWAGWILAIVGMGFGIAVLAVCAFGWARRGWEAMSRPRGAPDGLRAWRELEYRHRRRGDQNAPETRRLPGELPTW